MTRPTLFCGDPHGRFDQIFAAAANSQASAVVLLGDLEPARPLELELAPLLKRDVQVWWIGGNHDAESDEAWRCTWGSQLADRCMHGRVVQLPDGQRIAGLSGVFRQKVFDAAAYVASGVAPSWRTREQHAAATPRQSRWRGGIHRRHWGSIYLEDIETLAKQPADILVTHEAGGYHPHGFQALDDMARRMGVTVTVHGHQHDNLDSSSYWQSQGFRSFGVGLRGVSALWPDGRWEVLIPGELDDASAEASMAGTSPWT